MSNLLKLQKEFLERSLTLKFLPPYAIAFQTSNAGTSVGCGSFLSIEKKKRTNKTPAIERNDFNVSLMKNLLTNNFVLMNTKIKPGVFMGT